MCGINFDMTMSDLKTHCEESYNNAYFEISTILEEFNFYRTQAVFIFPTKMIWCILPER